MLGGPRAFVYVCVVAVGATCPMLLAAIYAFCTLPSSFRLAFFKTFAAHSILWVFDGYHKSWPPLLQILSGHKLHVRDIAFSPDGTRIASGSLDLTVRVWDVSSGVLLLGPLQGHTGHILSVAYSANG